MNISLKYGKQAIDLQLPNHAVELTTREPEFAVSKTAFLESLKNYLPVNHEAYRNIAIVVSDKTRLCGYPDYLPWLIEALEEAGAESSSISIYIAYGTHPKQTEEESLNTYGTTYKNYRFVHHDCYDGNALINIGSTSRGTEINIRRDVFESSMIITFGAISHHYFAGYGGGRKLLFPGLADRKAVYRNHSYFLDLKSRKLAAGCQPGNLKNNPIAEDLKEIDDKMPAKISIHGILNSSGKVCKLLIGNSYAEFESACREHDSYYRSGIDMHYDLVIASSGGYPKDINFIQGHKSIHHAAAFVKDNGKLVVFCECADGIGSAYFTRYLEAGSFEKAFGQLEMNYEGNGGTALSMITKAQRIHIHLITSLNADECNLMHVTKLGTGDVQPVIDSESGTIAVIRNASLMVK